MVEDGDEVTLVMAYLTGGTLVDRVGRHGPAPADEVQRLADDGLADDTPFAEGADPIERTMVLRDDVDTFALAVGDGSQLLCDGRFTVTVTAPAGMTVRLEVFDGDEMLGETTSADGVPSSVRLDETECFFSEARTLTARVSPIGSDRTGGQYRLERSGSF